jgi:glycosyltransferase involved in cell wall biosynthesis
LADVYKDSDIGLFPNRCEGGTNLVLMEYMACAKPAIASFVSGHRDVLTSNNSLPIRSIHPFRVQGPDGNILYKWEEPDLEEIVSLLEWAYWHRDNLINIGKVAGDDLSRRTWKESAKKFNEILSE